MSWPYRPRDDWFCEEPEWLTDQDYPAPRTTEWPIYCAWCARITGMSEVAGSTGICERCLEERYPE